LYNGVTESSAKSQKQFSVAIYPSLFWNRMRDMNSRELKRFEKMLLEERLRVLKEIGVLSKDEGNGGRNSSSSYGIHMAEVGNDEEELEKKHVFLTQEGDLLSMIDEALAKLKNGAFGKCERCDEPIAKERLLARPYAKYCLPCKQREERKK